MATAFSSPTLENEQIIGFFDDLQIRNGDLDKPEADTVQRLYRFCFYDITECPVERLRMSPAEGLEDIEYPELYETSDELKHFLLAMCWLTKKCGIEGFTINDLMTPKPRRTKWILSALINFAFFKNDRSKFYEQIKRERDADRELEETLLKENEELNRRINSIRAAQEEQEPECVKLKEEYELMASKMTEMNKQASQIELENKELEANLSEHKLSVDQTKVKIASMVEECDHLSRQIVQSPERVMKDEQRKKIQLQQLRDHKSFLETSLMEMKKLSHLREQLINDCTPLTNSLNNLSEKFTRNNIIIEEVSKIHESAENLNQENATVTIKINQQREILKNKEERKAKLQMQFKLKKQSMEDTVEQLRQTQDSRSEEQYKSKETEKTIEKEISALEKKHKEELYAQDELKAEFRSKYSELLEQIESYHCRFGGQIEKLLGTMHQ